MPNQLIIDLSSNNTLEPDWATRVKAAGVSAVFCKATEGQSYVNPKYAEWHSQAVAAGLDWAAYHYADFTNAAAEAAHFKAVAGPDAKILDGETSTNAAWENAFLAALGEPDDEELTYGSASTLSSGITRGFLWPAAWGPTDPRLPRELAWQNSDAGTVDGVVGRVDTSRWTGTDAAYEAFFAKTPSPTPTPSPSPTPQPTPQEVTVQVPVLSASNPGPKVVSQAVKNLQTLLIEHGFSCGSAGADGRFGAGTAAAVVAAEHHFGLAVDSGVAGEQVWSALCNK